MMFIRYIRNILKNKLRNKLFLCLALSISALVVLNSCNITETSNITFVSNAENAKCGDALEWKIDEGVLSIYGQGDMYDFEECLQQWFDAKEEIVSINVGNEVTSIGKNAFNGLCNVKKIEIGDKVTKLGTGAFSETQITTVNIPKNVTEIGGNLFSSYSDTKRQITIDEGNECFTIQDGVLYSSDMTRLVYCADLSDSAFAVPQTVTEIGDYAFAYQEIEEIQLPSSLKIIGDGAFKQCNNLKTVNINDSVVWIGEEAFMETQIQQVVFSNELIGIGKCAFAYCEELRSITFGENIKFIGEEAFVDCINLESVEFGNIHAVGRRAFYNCDNLKSVFVPDAATDIGKEAFGFRSIGGNSVTKCEDFVLKCNKTSAAHIYAEENKIEAIVIQ